MTVSVELIEPRDKREKLKFRLFFRYDPHLIALARGLGAKFVPESKGGPAWDLMADMHMGKLLRETFGDRLALSPAVRRWGATLAREATVLRSLSLGDTAQLAQLPDKLPKLYEAIHLGPRGLSMTKQERLAALRKDASYQAADVAFMARAFNCLNANQPGTGKTLEGIAAPFEGGFENGPKLVIAPKTSLESVWWEHLVEWQDQKVLVAPEGRVNRQKSVARALQLFEQGEPFWYICTSAMIQYRLRENAELDDFEGEGAKEEYILFPELHEVKWQYAIIDEFHKMGLANLSTGTSRAMNDMGIAHKAALSGTPLGGKAINLYGILHWLHPEEFSSKWRFVDTWLEVEKSDYRVKGGGTKEKRTPGAIRKDREEAFWDMLSQYVTRRTKAECLPWLPPKMFVPVWVQLDGKQHAQYVEFAREAEIRIDEENLTATSILAEYTRLRQFADAEQTILGRDEKGKPIVRPLFNSSAKLNHVVQLLDELGIRGGDEDEGDEQVLIFSQFTQVVDMITEFLTLRKINAAKITGDVTAAKRAALTKEFQAAKVRVLVMNTNAGGVSITLDNANTVILFDETWNPDDQEQAVDRAHRGSRIHQVTVYELRAKGTLEEYVQEINLDKIGTNYTILDLRRMHKKAVKA